MNPTQSAENDFTRRDFMKKSALTVGAITFLGKGIGLAQSTGSGSATACPKKPWFRNFATTHWLEGTSKPSLSSKPNPTITGPTESEPDKASANCDFGDLTKDGNGNDAEECKAFSKVENAPNVQLVERPLANGNVQYGWNLKVVTVFYYE